MATDHDGNTLAAENNIWVPCCITAIENTNQLVVTTSYSGATITGTILATDVHKSGNFPDRP